jgi:hypothetical protein
MADAFPSLFRLAVACLVVAACQAEPDGSEARRNIAEPSPATTNDLAPAPAQPSAFGTIGPLGYRYDPALLAPVETTVAVPPDWSVRVPGTKLVAADREKLIGKAECLYGLSGQASLCNAEQEAGLAFAVMDEPYEAMRARLSEELREPIRLGGIDGVSWTIGAEGEGAEHILLPTDGQTVLIVRQFRASGNPPEEAIAAVLQSLTPKTR